MRESDIKELIHEVLDDRTYASRTSARRAHPQKKKSMETSKALILFASIMYALTWVVAVYSWIENSIIPGELLKYSTYLYGASLAVYGGKAAYENKPKIENAFEQENLRHSSPEFP